MEKQKKRTLFWIIIESLSAAHLFAADLNKCNDLLVKQALPTLSDSKTDALIRYMSDLLKNHVLSDRELLALAQNLDGHDKLENLISEDQASMSSAHFIHREALEKYFAEKTLNRERLAEWTQARLAEMGIVRQRRQEVRDSSEKLFQALELHPIPPGSFKMGEDGKKRNVTLTHSIEAMSTPVTQKQWVDLMGANPSAFADGPHTIEVTVNGHKIKMQPNNPVESVSWWSTLVYANKLSEMHGLKPAYNLSEIRFAPGFLAEQGRLMLHNGVHSVRLKINAPGGDIYRAEGFRLPTSAEQEYLLRAGGSSDGHFPFEDSEAELKKYAWFNLNSGNTTHPVGELEPIIIGNKQFFDLFGNVWEWGYDQAEWGTPNTENINPRGLFSTSRESERGQRGGSWGSRREALHSGYSESNNPQYGNNTRGFRLVRTLDP